MMKAKIHALFKKYFEIAAFSVGLLLLALMNPESAVGPSLCLFEQVGITFCPGEGLGHSISYTFRGEVYNALQSNILGPTAIIILISRIGYLLFHNCLNNSEKI